jgi:DNA polymerase III subunit gamma/tau
LFFPLPSSLVVSLALARKYRPKSFADVAVQSHVANTLKGAIARGRVAHGYLLCGPRGVGKTTLARVLAMALNCENKRDDGEPCGQCTSCQRIWSGNTSLDVIEIDAASNRGVDDARQLRERAMYAPSGDDRYKVYIVDEAHMLTREAWNALLKILEEPPPRVVFVFATTEPQKIAQSAAPVLSRLQRFDFKRMGTPDIRVRVETILGAEHVAAESDALAMIARAADGSMRDALSLTDQVLSMGDGTLTAARVREALGLVPEDEFIGVIDLIAERRAADVFPLVARLADAGIDFGGFLTGLADMLRSQLAVTLGSASVDVSDAARDALVQRKDQLAVADVLRMLGMLAELEPRFRKSGQQQMLLETLLVRFALLDKTIELEDVLVAIQGGGAERASPSGGGGQAPRPPRAKPPAEITPVRKSASPEPADAVPVRAAPAQRPFEINALVSRWDDLVERLRGRGMGVLAAALAGATPATGTSAGEVIIRLEEPNPIHVQAIEEKHQEILGVLREWFVGVERLVVSTHEAATPPRRLTDDMLRRERLAALRKRDPVLGAAIDALDLDVVD